jgi:SPX domain protein involved in polyphosphate accumulation
MLVRRWEQRMSSLTDDSVTQISKFWILNENIAETKIRINPINVYDKMTATDKANIESKVQSAINIFKGSN